MVSAGECSKRGKSTVELWLRLGGRAGIQKSKRIRWEQLLIGIRLAGIINAGLAFALTNLVRWAPKVWGGHSIEKGRYVQQIYC